MDAANLKYEIAQEWSRDMYVIHKDDYKKLMQLVKSKDPDVDSIIESINEDIGPLDINDLYSRWNSYVGKIDPQKDDDDKNVTTRGLLLQKESYVKLHPKNKTVHCKGMTQSNKPCQFNALTGSEYCKRHNKTARPSEDSSDLERIKELQRMIDEAKAKTKSEAKPDPVPQDDDDDDDEDDDE